MNQNQEWKFLTWVKCQLNIQKNFLRISQEHKWTQAKSKQPTSKKFLEGGTTLDGKLNYVITKIPSNSKIVQFYPKDYIGSGKVKSMKSNNDRLSQLQKDWKPWYSSLITFYYKCSVLWGRARGYEWFVESWLLHSGILRVFSW